MKEVLEFIKTKYSFAKRVHLKHMFTLPKHAQAKKRTGKNDELN
jgi:hypothetical protein